MATSGSSNYSDTATLIIRDALLSCSALEEGENASGEQTSDALRTLNLIVKNWARIGDARWKSSDGILFLDKGVAEYTMGTDECALSNWGYGTLSTAAVATDATITLDSTAAPTVNHVAAATTYNVGLELDDGTRQWTTINGAPSSTVITLTATVTGAAAIGNTVFWYPTAIGKPVRLFNARRGLYNASQVPVRRVSRQEYEAQPTKGSQGEPVEYLYDPRRTDGRLKIWPTADSVRKVFWFTFEPYIEDFDSVANEPDFPVEWSLALRWELARHLMVQYQTPADIRQEIREMAVESYDSLVAFSADPAPYMMVRAHG